MAEKIIMLTLGGMLLFCGIQDLLKKKVHLWVIGFGVVLTVLCLPFVEHLSIGERIGGLSVGLVIILISKLTAGKIGMGDGMLLCVTGIGLGVWSNLELFGMALFLAALLSIILLVFRLVDRKKSIPFVPFLFIGYIILAIAAKGAII